MAVEAKFACQDFILAGHLYLKFFTFIMCAVSSNPLGVFGFFIANKILRGYLSVLKSFESVIVSPLSQIQLLISPCLIYAPMGLYNHLNIGIDAQHQPKPAIPQASPNALIYLYNRFPLMQLANLFLLTKNIKKAHPKLMKCATNDYRLLIAGLRNYLIFKYGNHWYYKYAKISFQCQ